MGEPSMDDPVAERGLLGAIRSPSESPFAAKALIASLALALLLRPTVSFLELPGILNFLFFPVLLVGLLGSRPSGTPTETRIMRAFIILTLAVAASSVANFASPLAAAILWASLVVPFLVVLVALRGWSRGPIKADVHHLVVFFLLAQAAVIAFERFVLGQTSDAAQGFLGGQGAGHHVVGFVGVGTALYLGMRMFEQRGLRAQPLLYVAIGAGLAIGAITGTMQSLLALGVTGVVFLATRRSQWPLLAPLTLGALILGLVFSAWVSFAPPARNWYGDEFFQNKGFTVSLILDEYQTAPLLSALGLAPGETATRVAWIGAGEGNLVSSLGLEPGGVARQLLLVEQQKPPWRSSSLTSPWSTWLGVWGDLGIFGLFAYASVWIVIARACIDRPSKSRAGLYLVLYLAILGAFYNWLEEPVLTLFLGLAVADAVVRSNRSERLADRVGNIASPNQPLR
ncbi:MAG: hypothetical protein V3S30_03185 [Thermoanaerobaculia bacterium]